MKFLFPCPGCRQRLTVPDQARQDAILRCPVCQHEISAQSWMADIFDEPMSWEIVASIEREDDHAASKAIDDHQLEFSSVSEDGVSFEPRDASDQVPFSDDMTPLDAVPLSTSSEDSLPERLDWPSSPSNSEHRDGLGAIALVASGEPDTFGGDDIFELPTEPTAEELESPDAKLALLELDEDDFSAGIASTPVNDEAVSELFSPLDDAKPFLDTQVVSTNLLDTQVMDSHGFDTQVFEPTQSERSVIEEQITAPTSLDQPAIQPSPSTSVAVSSDIAASPDALGPSSSASSSDTTTSSKRSVSPQLLQPGSGSSRSRRKKKKSPLSSVLSVIGGGAAAIPISMAILWYGFGTDPLGFGPSVAAIAPWLVPAELRGSQYFENQRLPQVEGLPDQSMLQNGRSTTMRDGAMNGTSSASGFSNANSNANVTLFPPQGTLEAPEPANAKDILDPSLFQPSRENNRGSLASSDDKAGTDSSGNMSFASNALPSRSSGLSSRSTTADADLSSEATELQRPKTALQIMRENQAHDDAIRASLSQLEDTFSAMEVDSIASAKLVVNSIEHLGKLLAAIPTTDPRYQIWQNQALPILQEMLAEPKIKQYFLEDFQRGKGKSPELGWVGSDLIMLDRVNQELTGVEWVASERKGSGAAASKIVAVPTLECVPEPSNFYWVIGTNEKNSEGNELVFRILIAIKFSPKNGK